MKHLHLERVIRIFQILSICKPRTKRLCGQGKRSAWRLGIKEIVCLDSSRSCVAHAACVLTLCLSARSRTLPRLIGQCTQSLRSHSMV